MNGRVYLDLACYFLANLLFLLAKQQCLEPINLALSFSIVMASVVELIRMAESQLQMHKHFYPYIFFLSLNILEHYKIFF
jgi:hypothetical protein